MLLKILIVMLVILLLCIVVYMDVPDKYIIIINGSGGSGKDQFCNFIAEEYKTKVVSSARLPKEIAEKYFKWKGSKNDKDRKMLSDLKDLMTEYNDIPYRDMCRTIEDFLNDRNQFLFIHVREPEEIQKLKDKYPLIKTLLIVRDDVKQIDTNHADANVRDYDYEYIIKNDGSLETFRIKASRFAKYIINGA